MKKAFILIPPTATKQATDTADLFRRDGWQVQFIDESTRSYHPNAVVIIPDTKGLNVNVEYVKIKSFSFPPQDQLVEAFRLNSLFYWVKKKTPVIGIGTSAYLTFAELCQGTLIFGPHGMSIGASKQPCVVEDAYFLGEKCGGLWTYDEDELLLLAAKLLTGPEPQGVLIPA